MRLLGPDLKCIECRKKSNYDELEVVTKENKKYWICPHCNFENLFVDVVRG
jgi:DNA-directed RNA polymerase subunit RPC12/RpoP